MSEANLLDALAARGVSFGVIWKFAGAFKRMATVANEAVAALVAVAGPEGVVEDLDVTIRTADWADLLVMLDTVGLLEQLPAAPREAVRAGAEAYMTTLPLSLLDRTLSAAVTMTPDPPPRGMVVRPDGRIASVAADDPRAGEVLERWRSGRPK